jgi:YceI-like domain
MLVSIDSNFRLSRSRTDLPRSKTVKKQMISGLVATILVASFGIAEAKLAGSGGEVSFTALGPGGLKIVGTTKELSVKDDGSSVTIVVPLNNLDTGIGLRNKHMREKYLEVDKYPNAELSVSRATLKFADGSGSAPGTMKIHGQSKPVTFNYTAKKSGSSFSVDGSVHLNMKEFGIEVPSYLGVTVKPEVDVTTKFTAIDN